jgi:hypothetical protein
MALLHWVSCSIAVALSSLVILYAIKRITLVVNVLALVYNCLNYPG